MHLWEDQSLPAPFPPDVIDYLFGEALVIANGFQDLVQEFDDANSDWAGSLVGADPSAIGRNNRGQRAAGIGIQLGTHLSTKVFPC